MIVLGWLSCRSATFIDFGLFMALPPQGLCVIMDNMLSIPVMKELLPLLHHCIHDTSEKVRIAFCELLLVVKGLKSIKVDIYGDEFVIHFNCGFSFGRCVRWKI